MRQYDVEFFSLFFKENECLIISIMKYAKK